MPRRRSWTDDDLRRAVADASTYTEVMRLLRERTGGCDYVGMRVRIAELALQSEHLEDARRRERAQAARARKVKPPALSVDRRTWTDDDLREAVAESQSINGVFRYLGLQVGGQAWLTLKGRIRDLGLDTSHFVRSRPWQPPWSDEALREAVAASRSIAQVLRELGESPTNSKAHQRVRDHIDELGLGTSHMTGQGWARGQRLQPRYKHALDEILVENSAFGNTHALKLRLIREGVKQPKCEMCGLSEWNGKPIPLQLDHINGDRRDNRLENLRLLCPNCHAQTDTWCSKNRGRYDRDEPVDTL